MAKPLQIDAMKMTACITVVTLTQTNPSIRPISMGTMRGALRWGSALIIWSLLACAPQFTPRSELHLESPRAPLRGLIIAQAGPRDEAKLRWIGKTARTLRAGAGLSPSDDINRLVKLSQQEIIDEFMKDSRFGDMMLDFNLYFLGIKPDLVRTPDGGFADQVYVAPGTISSARAVLANQDYFEFFANGQPMYLPPLGPPAPANEEEAKLPTEAIRQLKFDLIQHDLDKLIETLKVHPKLPKDEFKNRLEAPFQFQWFTLGVPFTHVAWLMTAKGWYGEAWNAARSKVLYAKTDLVAELFKIKEVNRKFFEQLKSFDPKVYKPLTVQDLKAIDLKALGVSETWSLFNPGSNQALPNSSTNYNRKRAAFVLSRFFCDDLTPINVIAPDSHAKGRHGSDAACQACHYKLDPMAGFFRNYGVFFKDFSELGYIRFEDNAFTDLDQYTQAWKADPKSGRDWDIGYIRSTEKPALNDYGNSIEDMMAIIRKSPEVKRCIVKRAFEYFVAENQSVDGGYIEELAQDFSLKSKSNSTHAFKSLVSKILLSNAYSEPDPVPNQCYDYPSGYDPSKNPPCQIAFVLKNNCVSCHDQSSQKGGLDLSRWITLPDGSSSFPHTGSKGQHTKRETFESILQRITSLDEDERMPLRKYISSSDREQLYLWFKSNLDAKPVRPSP